MAENREVGPASSVDGERFDVVVAGAGIGGLACGALLAESGKEVLIVERRERPGGYAASYERKGYSFQVPGLMGGCGPDEHLTFLLNHLGVRVDFDPVDPFMRYLYPDHDLTVSSRPGAFRDALKDGFQPQTANINRFFKAAEGMRDALDLRGMRAAAGFGGALRRAGRSAAAPRLAWHAWRGTTLKDLLDGFFTDERIKTVLATPWTVLGAPPWELSALSMLWLMRSFSLGAFFPRGGFGALSEELARVFRERGGTLLTGHEVIKINCDRGRVASVDLDPRATVQAPVVVSDVDTRRLFLRLIDRENLTQGFIERISGLAPSHSGFVMSLGLAKEVDDPRLMCGILFFRPSYDDREMIQALSDEEEYPEPSKMAWSAVVHSACASPAAREGRSCLNIIVPLAPYNFMRRWGLEPGGQSGERNRRVKEKYGEKLVEAVSGVFPDLVDRVEAYDLLAPTTYERRSMASDGCWFDLAPVPGAVMRRRPGPVGPVPGLFLTGSKSAPGPGIHGSLTGGLLAADAVMEGGLSYLF